MLINSVHAKFISRSASELWHHCSSLKEDENLLKKVEKDLKRLRTSLGAIPQVFLLVVFALASLGVEGTSTGLGLMDSSTDIDNPAWPVLGVTLLLSLHTVLGSLTEESRGFFANVLLLISFCLLLAGRIFLMVGVVVLSLPNILSTSNLLDTTSALFIIFVPSVGNWLLNLIVHRLTSVPARKKPSQLIHLVTGVWLPPLHLLANLQHLATCLAISAATIAATATASALLMVEQVDLDREAFLLLWVLPAAVSHMLGSLLLLVQQRRTLSGWPEQPLEEEEEERGYWEFGSNKEGLTKAGQMDGWQAALDKRNRQVPQEC